MTGITAREIMTPVENHDAQCVRTDQSLIEAAQRMRDLDVGALPICGEDGRLQGMLTDRDIVVRCVADGADPGTVQVADLAGGRPVTIGADDSLAEALRTMTEHGVRRLPVIDGHDLVGMLSQADLARSCPPAEVGELVEAISRSPSTDVR